MLCYAGAWVSGLIMLSIERESTDVRFHAWHALLAFGALTLLAITCWLVTILMAFVSPGAFRVLAGITQAAWVLLAVVWVIALVQAIRGARWKLPVVGQWAERLSQPRL